MRLNNNAKHGTSSGNEMELSPPSQRVSVESPYVIPDTNGSYGNYQRLSKAYLTKYKNG